MVPLDHTPKSLTALALTDLESLLERRPVQTTRGPSMGKLRVVVVTNQGAVSTPINSPVGRGDPLRPQAIPAATERRHCIRSTVPLFVAKGNKHPMQYLVS